MDNNNQGKNRIEQLKKGLYSKRNIFSKKVPRLLEKEYDVKTDWKIDKKPEDLEMVNKKRKRKTFLEKILLFSIIFFLVAVAVTAFTIFTGFNKVSTENVDISVVGPTSVESGGELSLQVTTTNNNAADLELADLTIKFPSGTHRGGDSGGELGKVRESLNTIGSGKSIRKEVKAILYGEENSEQQIIISLEYRIAGSNAIFFKERKYDIRISSSPVNLVISPLSEVISGQEIELTASVISNAKGPVNNLLVSVDYPFGFEFKEATPKPDTDNNIWKISTLKPGGEKIIKIRGIITGQNQEERVFKFTSGAKDKDNKNKIGSLFASVVKSLVIRKPFIGIDLALNGNKSKEYISSGNKPVRVDVSWFNNSSFKIIDAEIRLKLKGEMLDKPSVSVDDGFYNSVDNTIIWNKTTSGELSEINPGDSGNFSFSFRPLSISQVSVFINPEISLDASVSGNRLSESNVPEEIDSSVSKKIKISSDLSIAPMATYYSGPFVNSGFIPPQAEKETTYTITWSAANTTNNVSDTKVTASLPTYVRWLGVVSPKSENISYNPVGGEIIWSIGDIKAGTGINYPAKEVSFQVALLPSVSQVGNTPILVNNTTITGIDKFTKSELKSMGNEVTTRLVTDPGFNPNNAAVVSAK